MNSFWEQQEQARSRTGRLILLFTFAVVAIVFSIYLPLAIIIHIREFSFSSIGWLWSSHLFAWTAFPILLIIAIGTISEWMYLTKGGGALALQLKARQVDHPASLQEKMLVNVVEEMAIASGIPSPSIHVLDRAPDSINALVAGNTVDDAAIIVSQGCLDQLSREELQAVIAHEFSHVFNGDMRLNLRTMSLVYGVLALAIVGFGVMFPDEEFGCLSVALGLPLVLLGGVGGAFSKLIQKAVSREREYLADASAVQFTRNPEALLGALAKIEPGSSRIKASAARAANHLFFADCRRRAWIPLLRTHPSLRERRRRIGSLVISGSREDSPLSQGLRQQGESGVAGTE